MPIFESTSAGSQVNSEPVSTNASTGGGASSSRLGLDATTLTLNMLTRALNTRRRVRASWLSRHSTLLQLRDGFLHFLQVNIGLRRIGDVRDLAIEADEKAHASGDFFAGGPRGESVGDLAVRVREQREVQFVFL